MAATKESPPPHLRTYLNDHLAAATAGIELAKRARGNNAGSPLGETLGRLVPELEGDRETLRSIMAGLGIPVTRPKQVLAVLAERVGRLKFNGSLVSYSDLSRIEELEMLATGVVGKRSLWTALQEVAGQSPQLQRFDFADLAERADQQHRVIEGHRRQAAREAFAERAEA